jgi:outer membrane protein assembly factor BamB
VGLDCIDAVSGRRLWQKNHDIQATRLLLAFPAGLFMVQGDSLIYSAGQELWTVRGTDGTVLDRQLEDRVIGDNVSHSSVPPGPVYFVTAQPEISAYDPALKTITRTPRPEVDSPQLTMRGNTLFAVDKGSAYRFDIGSGLKWMIPGATTAAFLRIRDDGSRLWALRSDNVLVAIDPVTGKVLREYSTLWRPLAYNVIGDRLYALTADGLAYAILLSH